MKIFCTFSTVNIQNFYLDQNVSILETTNIQCTGKSSPGVFKYLHSWKQSIPASVAVDKADLPGLPFPETLTPLGSKMFDNQLSPPDRARTTPTLCEDAVETNEEI